MNLLSTKQVAEKLGVSLRRVQAMITAGKLPAGKLGRDYFVREEDLKLVTVYGKAGRPPKSESSRVETKSKILAAKTKKKAK